MIHVSSSNLIQYTSFLVGNATGFVAKQYFCFNALEAVRQNLQKTISSIAEAYFGTIAGRLIAQQAATNISIPYTAFLGDLIWTTTSELIQSAVMISCRQFNFVDTTFRQLPMWVEVSIRISSVVVTMLAKQMFIHVSMPYVKIALEKILVQIARHGFSNSIFLASSTTVVPFAAITMTPMVTFFLADMISHIFQASVYFSSTGAVMLAYNHFSPEVQDV